MSSKWDHRFMRVAREVSTWSKDRATKVGAVLVRNKRIIATGYNGFATGVNDDVEERHERPLKYPLTLHAEQNAILSAARFGQATEGCVMYVCSRTPCAVCTNAMVNAGIKECVVETLEPSKRKEADWEVQHKATEIVRNESGIIVRLLEPESREG